MIYTHNIFMGINHLKIIILKKLAKTSTKVFILSPDVRRGGSILFSR
jgi:hypothetical protein